MRNYELKASNHNDTTIDSASPELRRQIEEQLAFHSSDAAEFVISYCADFTISYCG